MPPKKCAPYFLRCRCPRLRLEFKVITFKLSFHQDNTHIYVNLNIYWYMSVYLEIRNPGNFSGSRCLAAFVWSMLNIGHTSQSLLYSKFPHLTHWIQLSIGCHTPQPSTRQFEPRSRKWRRLATTTAAHTSTLKPLKITILNEILGNPGVPVVSGVAGSKANDFRQKQLNNENHL